MRLWATLALSDPVVPYGAPSRRPRVRVAWAPVARALDRSRLGRL